MSAPQLVVVRETIGVLEVSAPAGPMGPMGPTGPSGSDGFVAAMTEPDVPNGIVWVKYA